MENIEDIKKGVKIYQSLSNKTEIYLYNNILYKLFNDHSQIESRERILNILHKNPIKECPKIYSLLYEGDLKGYGMEYLKKYKTLRKTKNINCDLKKEYCHKIIKIYEYFKKLGFIYYDFHTLNVLVNKNDLKLIDIDSVLMYSNEKDITGKKYLNELVLSILYDCIFFDYQIYFDKKERYDIQEILCSDLSYSLNKVGSLEELDYYIDTINNKKIKEMKKKLPKGVLK